MPFIFCVGTFERIWMYNKKITQTEDGENAKKTVRKHQDSYSYQAQMSRMTL